MDAKVQRGDFARRRRLEANRPAPEGGTRERRSLCRSQGNHRQLRGHPGRQLRRSRGDCPCVSARAHDRDPRTCRLRMSEPEVSASETGQIPNKVTPRHVGNVPPQLVPNRCRNGGSLFVVFTQGGGQASARVWETVWSTI